MLADRFEIRASLGEGALGHVYRAYDQEAEVEVALKTLRADLLPTGEARARALAFASQVARLNHPNLVRIFHVAEHADGLFFVMQLIEGLTLRETIARRHGSGAEPVTVAEVEAVVSQVAAGLTAGYRLGPHGDLRPENVVMLPSIVKIADFGFASVVARAAFLAAATVRGAGPYLAPEVARGEAPSAAADVYALAVMTAEFLTGTVVGPGFLLRERRPDLPETLAALLGNCLAPDPAARIDDPDQLARGIRAHVSEVTNAFSVATRARSMSVRQSTVAPAPSPVNLPGAAPPSPPNGQSSRTLSPTPRTPTGAFAAIAAPPPPVPASNTPPPAPQSELTPVLAQDERSAVTHNAAVLPPGTAVTSLRTAVAAEDASAVIAAREVAARNKRPVPLFVWIVVILLLIGGATYGAISFIDNQQAEAERALVEQQARERLLLEAERGRHEAARKAQQEAENNAKRAAEEARRKAEEAAKAAKEDPLKKAEAERLAKEAQDKEDEQKKLEKKRKEDERKEAAKEKKASEKEAKEERETARKDGEDKTPTGGSVTPAEPPKPVDPPKVDPPKETIVAVARPPEETKPPEEKKPECPSGMARIKAGSFRMGSAEDDPMRNFSEKRLVWVKTEEYCIDRFEFPNQRGARPKTAVNWNTAKSLCESAGKRLCTEKEWERACKGYKNYRYPYGDEFADDKCNTETKGGEKRGITGAGAFGSCRSQFGVFDLSGNAWEWTATALGGGAAMIIKGGAANKPDWAVRCANRGNKPSGSRDAFLGFRCCATPSAP